MKLMNITAERVHDWLSTHLIRAACKHMIYCDFIVFEPLHADGTREARIRQDEASSYLTLNYVCLDNVHTVLLKNDEAHEQRWSKVMINDWLRARFIRAMCMATELMLISWTPRRSNLMIVQLNSSRTELCARRQFSWTTLKQAHHRLCYKSTK